MTDETITITLSRADAELIADLADTGLDRETSFPSMDGFTPAYRAELDRLREDGQRVIKLIYAALAAPAADLAPKPGSTAYREQLWQDHQARATNLRAETGDPVEAAAAWVKEHVTEDALAALASDLLPDTPAEGTERFAEAIPATGAPLERVGYEVAFAYPDELAAVRAAAKRDSLTVGAWIKHAAMRAAEGPERAATGETGYYIGVDADGQKVRVANNVHFTDSGKRKRVAIGGGEGA